MTHRHSVLKKMSRSAKAIFVAMGLLVGSASVVNAASTGNVDTTWASSGVFSASVFHPDETQGVATAALAGGKTLHLARQLLNMNSSVGVGYGLFQLTSNGALDTTFSTDGWLKQGLTVGGVTYKAIYVNSLNVLSDGKILVAGTATSSNDTNGVFVAKYLSTGSLDTSFGTGGFSVVTPDDFAPSVPDTTNMGYPAVTVAASGKIYAWFTVNINRIFRLNADGSKDSSFSSGRGFVEGLATSGVLGQTEVGAFTVDESVTPPVAYAAGVHLDRGGTINSSAIVYKVKFDSTAVLDTSYSGTSNFTGETNPTLGYVRVDLGAENLQYKGAAISSDGFAYIVGGLFAKSYVAAIDVNLGKRHDTFGTSGVSDFGALGITNVSSLRVSGTGATRTVLAIGADSTRTSTVVKYVNDVLDSSFGTSGVAKLSTCRLIDIGDVALTTAADGGIVVIGNVSVPGTSGSPQTPQVIRLGAGAATNTCGASAGGPAGVGGATLPTLTGTVEEVAGPGIKVTVPALADGARLNVALEPSTFTFSPDNVDNPVMRVGDVGATSVTFTSITWLSPDGKQTRSTRLEVGETYTVIYRQRIDNPSATSSLTITTITITGNVAAETPAETPAVIPGVTVTDTKVYTKAVPKKVAAGSAIAVMTPAQAKTRDVKTLTPSVCLPANDDLVFIKTGRCVAQVVSERTGAVLRTLRTRVVADEVSELNVGNAIVTLTPIYFGGASASVDARAKKRLQSIKDRISAAGNVLIVGHSGILMGNTLENQEMGRARAISTRNELRSMGAKGPFYFTSAGALAPATTKMTQAAQAKNRRVVIVLIP